MDSFDGSKTKALENVPIEYRTFCACWQMEVANESKLIMFIEQKSRMIQFDAGTWHYDCLAAQLYFVRSGAATGKR